MVFGFKLRFEAVLFLICLYSNRFCFAHASGLSASDFYVYRLPGQPSGSHVTMHAGTIIIDQEHHAGLFFWHVKNKHLADRSRTIIWLNGGPGCSSEDGMLFEIGPFRIKDAENLVENTGSWHQFANILSIDQPAGTGFSYVDTDSFLHELPQMTEHLIKFLLEWFKLFPEHANDDLFIAGESFAGQYIPYLAERLLEYNTKNDRNMGLLIGNGWIDPATQYQSFLPFAYQNGLIEKGTHIANNLEVLATQCYAEIKQNLRVSISKCEEVLTRILEATKTNHNGKCSNMYDIRLTDDYPSCGLNWPKEIQYLTQFLRKPEVLKALHVSPEKKIGWTECTGIVSSSFTANHSAPSSRFFPKILDQIPILLFSGDKDLICNHLGTEEFIHNLAWANGSGFQEASSSESWAPRKIWLYNDSPTGYYQSARNLTYVLFYNASHMVAYDKPNESLDMLNRFMGVDISGMGLSGGSTGSIIGGERVSWNNNHDFDHGTGKDPQDKKVSESTWRAYYRAGAVALVFVIIGAGSFSWYVYRQRQREGATTLRDYLLGNKSKQNFQRDSTYPVDENELDELVVDSPIFDADLESRDMSPSRTSLK